MKRIVLPALAGLCLSLPGLTHADVTFYGAQKTAFYTEGSDDDASFTNTSLFAFVDTDSSSDAASFTVTTDTGNASPLTLTAGSGSQYSGSNFYSSISDLNAAYPAGSNYVFTAVGGNLAGDTDSLPVAADAYAPTLVLTGTTYDSLQNLDATAGVNINYAPLGGGANTGSTDVSLTIVDSSNDVVYSTDGGTGDFFIPGGTLKSGSVYSAQLANFNTLNIATAGDFAGVNNSDGFVTSTLFSISTAATPEPSTYALLGLGLVLLFCTRRRMA